MYSFIGDYIAGSNGELLFEQFLISQRLTYEKILDSAIQKSGVDFRYLATEGWVDVEVKTDFISSRTGNVAIETISNIGRNTPGWGLSCSAAELAFIWPQKRKIYIVSVVELKFHLARWRVLPNAKRAVASTRDDRGRVMYQTEVLLVPFDTFRRALQPCIVNFDSIQNTPNFVVSPSGRRPVWLPAPT